MDDRKQIYPVKVDKTTLINIEKGMLPPQAIELEVAILGAMLVSSKGLYEAMEMIFAEAFYKDAHKNIFEAMWTLFNKNQPVDLLTVSAELKRTSKLELSGGDFYLIEITQKISSSAHIGYHCRIVLQKYIQRRSIRVSSELIQKSYDEDVDSLELLESVYKEYGEISDLISVGRVQNFKTNVLEYLNTSKSTKKGVPSSLTKLNLKFNGYQNSDLIILAARPGMGKTAVVLNEILEAGLNNIPTALFSLEMSTTQIIGRFLSIISGIDITKINNHNLTSSETLYLNQCSKLLSEMPIFIDDTGGISPIELKIKMSKLKRENGIRMAFVDYLQLMKVKNKKVNNRENEISEISQSLKNIAKELNIPVMALSQLSRSVEQRGSSKRPLLSDLRDSGSIEQDADIVMFVYRPEYYKIDRWDDEEQSPTTNQAEIDVAKYRHGETGVCRIGCELRYMRFMDIENIGQDMTGKYFKDVQVPEKPPEMITVELPKIDPQQAFGEVNFNPDNNDDVPF